MTFTQLRVQRTQLEAPLPQSFEKPNIGKPQRILKVEGDKKPNIGKPQRILKVEGDKKPNIGKPQRILKVEGDKKPNIGKPQRILKKSLRKQSFQWVLRTLGPPIRISI